jgi:hypothetical protein
LEGFDLFWCKKRVCTVAAPDLSKKRTKKVGAGFFGASK